MTVENNNLFEEINQTEETPQVIENAFETLVGEGKKYADQETLAKSAIEKDNFIKRLQQEQADLRAELEKRQTIDQFLERLEQKRQESMNSNSGTTPLEPHEDEVPEKLTPEKIEELLQKKLSERESEARKEQNLQKSIEAMKKAWGDSAQSKLNEKAKELGLTVKQLQEYAKENSNVFVNLLGINNPAPNQTQQTTVPQGSVDSSKTVDTGGQEKTQSYYDKLRKENPSVYFSPKTQNEMHRQAIKLGPAFFK